jgi:hypothetical protein
MHQQSATNTPQSPFILTSLALMAGKGYDAPALIEMQRQALRAAGQIVQRRNAGGMTTTAGELQRIVERLVAGDDYKGPGGEVSAFHIKSYMEFKVAQNMAPAQLLKDADALSKIQLPEEMFGKEPALQATNWLAKHLAILKQYANNIGSKTPFLAEKVRERIAEIEEQVQDKAGLKLALSVIREAAEASEHGQDPASYTHLEGEDEGGGDRHGH